MDNKRLIIFVLFCSALFIGKHQLSVYMGWYTPPAIEESLDASTNGTVATPASQGVEASVLPAPSSADPAAPAEMTPALGAAFYPADGPVITVETPLYRAVLYRDGVILKDFFLLRHRLSMQTENEFVSLVNANSARQAPLALLVNSVPTWKGTNWVLETPIPESGLRIAAGQEAVLVFTGEVNGMQVRRELSFNGDTYLIGEVASVTPTQPQEINLAFTTAGSQISLDETMGVLATIKYYLLGGARPAPSESPYNLTRVAWFQNGSFTETSSAGDLEPGMLVSGNVSWMGIMNNYFMSVASLNDTNSIAKGGMVDGVFTALIGRTRIVGSQEMPATLTGSYFLGPKSADALSGMPNNLEDALNYGFFHIIAKPLIQLLRFFYSFLGNYGYAIIALTIVIRLLMWPLSHKSFKSMDGMRKMQPVVQEIREKYKDDKEAMNRELMAAYKRYKVNPAGGCLPILLQLPIFIGLYQALLNSVELRHAVFIETLPFTNLPWLADLSAPDPFFITPLVMGASMIIQQKMTPAPGDPTQAKIMMFMPIIFTFLFLGFPSGLVLYWLVSNVLGIAQQWWQMDRSIK